MLKKIIISVKIWFDKLTKLNKRRVVIAAISVLIAAALGGILEYKYITRDNNPIPNYLRSSLNFSPFVLPTDTKNYLTSDYKFSYAENKVQIMSYIVRLPDGSNVAVSEYPQPPEFTEITEYKDRFLSNIANQYETVPNSNGTIYLGRAVKQNNKQLAIMIERGLLVFMSPNKDLDTSEWRNLGDRLEIQKNLQ